MATFECRTQAELDGAIAKSGPFDIISLLGDGHFIFRESSSPTVEAWESSSPRVEAWESSSPTVVARESSSPTVVARGSSSPRVEAWGSSSPRVEAWESSSPRVEAWGSSSPRVEARESSSPTVEAWGSSSPRVEARESSSPTVVARESSSPTVVARGSSSPRVEAWGSSSPTVEAWESSSPRGTASRYAPVVVHRHDKAIVDIAGAILIEAPVIATAAEWCEYYGVAVVDGVATLYKGVGDDYATWRSRDAGIFYRPGTSPEAPDWDGGLEECGGGLHFSPHPELAVSYETSATRFVACPVRLDEIVVHSPADYPDKVKAPRIVGPIVEVDRSGKPVAAPTSKPKRTRKAAAA